MTDDEAKAEARRRLAEIIVKQVKSPAEIMEEFTLTMFVFGYFDDKSAK